MLRCTIMWCAVSPYKENYQTITMQCSIVAQHSRDLNINTVLCVHWLAGPNSSDSMQETSKLSWVPLAVVSLVIPICVLLRLPHDLCCTTDAILGQGHRLAVQTWMAGLLSSPFDWSHPICEIFASTREQLLHTVFNFVTIYAYNKIK